MSRETCPFHDWPLIIWPPTSVYRYKCKCECKCHNRVHIQMQVQMQMQTTRKQLQTVSPKVAAECHPKPVPSKFRCEYIHRPPLTTHHHLQIQMQVQMQATRKQLQMQVAQKCHPKPDPSKLSCEYMHRSPIDHPPPPPLQVLWLVLHWCNQYCKIMLSQHNFWEQFT